MIVRRRFRVHGKVQGVFFRKWTVAEAQALGVAGWVRNRADGSVEIFACGPEPDVTALAGRCRTGPPAARVDRVEVEDSDDDCPPDFTKRPSP